MRTPLRYKCHRQAATSISSVAPADVCKPTLYLSAALASAPCVAHVMEFQPHVEEPGNRFIDKPEINPSPEHVLVIRGLKSRNFPTKTGTEIGPASVHLCH